MEDYGYSLEQMAQEIKVNNSQRGQGKALADIVVLKSNRIKLKVKPLLLLLNVKRKMFVFVKKIIIRNTSRLLRETYYAWSASQSTSGKYRAVITALRFQCKMIESECLADLMKMYQDLVRWLLNEYNRRICKDTVWPIWCVQQKPLSSWDALGRK